MLLPSSNCFVKTWYLKLARKCLWAWQGTGKVSTANPACAPTACGSAVVLFERSLVRQSTVPPSTQIDWHEGRIKICLFNLLLYPWCLLMSTNRRDQEVMNANTPAGRGARKGSRLWRDGISIFNWWINVESGGEQDLNKLMRGVLRLGATHPVNHPVIQGWMIQRYLRV